MTSYNKCPLGPFKIPKTLEAHAKNMRKQKYVKATPWIDCVSTHKYTIQLIHMTWFVQNYTGSVHIVRMFCVILIGLDSTAYPYHQCIFACH